MKYSKRFRNAILRKVLPPENRSVYSVAKEAGIAPITINSWLAKLKDGKLDIEQDRDDPVSSRSINEQDNPVHHGQGPLNFAPKVGMAGSVEHVYFDTFPYYGAILCGDGDSAVLFKIHVVHHAFRHFFAFTECARLPEHCVYQCGLAMVNMRDYRDVSYHGVHYVCVFQCNS